MPISVSISISSSLRSIYITNVVKTLMTSMRIAVCQLAPAYAARDAALLSLETPGSWTMLVAAQQMISQAFFDINGAIAAAYKGMADDMVDFKAEIDVDLGGAIDALQNQLGAGFGAFNAAVNGAQGLMNTLDRLQAWKDQVDSYFTTAEEWYDTAATPLDAGDSHSACDKAKAWEKVGNKLIEFIPSF